MAIISNSNQLCLGYAEPEYRLFMLVIKTESKVLTISYL